MMKNFKQGMATMVSCSFIMIGCGASQFSQTKTAPTQNETVVSMSWQEVNAECSIIEHEFVPKVIINQSAEFGDLQIVAHAPHAQNLPVVRRIDNASSDHAEISKNGTQKATTLDPTENGLRCNLAYESIEPYGDIFDLNDKKGEVSGKAQNFDLRASLTCVNAPGLKSLKSKIRCKGLGLIPDGYSSILR